jgi:NADPH:quinone reductase-like Zn-dependent oxidoreductase
VVVGTPADVAASVAAVQIARQRGAQVITTAGPTYTDALRATGADVTPYGDGMVERVRDLAGGPVGLVLDATRLSDVVPELVRTVSAPEHVLTLSNFTDAEKVGARGWEEGQLLRNDVLGEYAQLATEGRFTIPIARTFPLDDWRAAVEQSRSKSPRGKLILQIG